MALKPINNESLGDPSVKDREKLNNLNNSMSKPPDKRETENARIVADTLKFLAADQRRANKSRRAVQKTQRKISQKPWLIFAIKLIKPIAPPFAIYIQWRGRVGRKDHLR